MKLENEIQGIRMDIILRGLSSHSIGHVGKCKVGTVVCVYIWCFMAVYAKQFWH